MQQDDLDDGDVAAFSLNMVNEADEFKTLGMVEEEKK